MLADLFRAQRAYVIEYEGKMVYLRHTVTVPQGLAEELGWLGVTSASSRLEKGFLPRRITTSIGLPQTRQSAFSALAAPRAVTFVLLAPLSFAMF